MGEELTIDYSLIRENRKTLTINIRGGKIIVKAPQNYPLKSIESFIALKTDWIFDKLDRQTQQQNEFKMFFDFDKILFLGKSYSVSVTHDIKKCVLSNDIFLVPSATDYSSINKASIKNWYIKNAKKLLFNFLCISSKNMGLDFKNFSLTNAKSKWGSCDSEKNIRLNWRLIFFNEEIIKYVIVHELCHTIHHNHSKDFWNSVKKFDSDYLKKKKALKDAGILIDILRG